MDGLKPTIINRAGGIAAGLAFVVIWFSDFGLTPKAHHLSAVFVAVVILWITEALPIAVTALLIAPLLVLTEVANAKEAFAPYANPLLFLFVGGFMIAKAMTRHGLDKRIALSLVSMPWIRWIPLRVRAVFMLTGVLLSMWISNSATTAILLPIFLGLLPSEDNESSAASGSILAIAFACSLGGLGTPVGSPPNLIAMGFLNESGIDFGFLDWIKIGLPSAILMVIFVFLVFLRGSKQVFLTPSTDSRPTPSSLSRGERWTTFVFLLAICGWMIPGIFQALDSPTADILKKILPGGVVAIFSASILFMARDESQNRVLPWSDGKTIDWGIIILFGGGLSLGVQMMETGLAQVIAESLIAKTGLSELWPLVFWVTAFTIFFTEVCSNTATSNMLAPLVLAMAHALDVSPIPPLLAVGLAASCAFMLPIATGPNAIAYGTGRVKQMHMIKYGFILNVICAISIWCMLRLLCPLYGWI